ncbi:MAG TPA: DUF488 domain-containing protein [Solirubrobacteraceae bacterium]|jgi:uncharacterized protein (DUF488 family)|nr:DUF488 domain-containing protein [Solirubrobacteraceae bacterium]
MARGTIYTVGHSTREFSRFAQLLLDAGVDELVDVRRVPHSRRHPQFDSAALARTLAELGIDYRHEEALGGFRRPLAASGNAGWEHEAFRGYADYMATPQFTAALARVQQRAATRALCLMCAEAQWWRCHRRLISDALVVAGWRVLHLGVGREPVEHELTPFAVVLPDGAITYPPRQGELALADVGMND